MSGILIRPEVVAAERAIVGQVLLRPDTLDLLALYPEQFGDMMSREAWRAMVEVRFDGRPIDAITVAEAVPAHRGELRREMPTFLSSCLLDVVTADNAETYADIVRRGHVTRRALTELSGVVERGRSGEVEGDELVGEALAAIARLDGEQPDAAVVIGEAIRDRFKALEEMAIAAMSGKEPALNGAPTGVAKLDRKLGGLRYGLATVICGRPGMGKSSLAMGIADTCSASGLGVHEFSLEDTRDTRADRALARQSKVPAQDMQRAQLSREQLGSIKHAAVRLWARKNWLVDDRSGISAEEVVRSVRRRRKANGTKVVIVDYLQLLARPRDAKSVHEWHSHSINTLANAAKRDGICYVVLSQLSREVERRNDKRPMLSDLRESGAIEERAKQVIGLYRGSYYGAPTKGVDYGDGENERSYPTDEEWQSRVDLLVMKNQNGSTGIVEAIWDGPTTSIR